MELNRIGFKEPRIDQEACIGCRACERVCPVLKEVRKHGFHTRKGFAASLKDSRDILQSTSGGVFYALASQAVTLDGGAVFGARLDEDMVVRTAKATNLDEIEQLRKSKYVQCVIPKGLFLEVKTLLKEGKKTLFSGVPCQVAALAAYLETDYENLLMVEVFCSNAVSYLSWMKYQDYVNRAYGKKLRSFQFRKKVLRDEYTNPGLYISPWKSPVAELIYEDGSIFEQTWEENLWTKGCQLLLMYRECCTDCRFGIASTGNCADISIGDFWGVETNLPENFNDKGTSAVIVHTKKGERALKRAKTLLNIAEVNEAIIRKSNEACFTHLKGNGRRDVFLNSLAEPDVTYDQALTEAMGFGRVGIVHPYVTKVGLIGGFNLRSAVHFGAPPFTRTCFHYSNISLVGLLSKKIAVMESVFPFNQVRAEMLKIDLERKLFDKNVLSGLDYLILDFIEERFDIGMIGQSYITLSDAFLDSDLKSDCILSREKGEVDDLWKEACKVAILRLKELFKQKQIILVKNFLALQYVDDQGIMHPFKREDVGFDVEEMNKRLSGYYDYFEINFEGVHVVTPKQDLNLTPEKYKHGRIPSHAGERYINYVTKLILKELGYLG